MKKEDDVGLFECVHMVLELTYMYVREEHLEILRGDKM